MPQDDREKKLSQEEVRVSNLAKKFIHQASITAKNFRMFGNGHPVLQQSIRNTYELLKNILTGKDSLTFTLMGDSLLIENMPLKNLDLKVYSLIGDMKECGISSLTFLNELEKEELNLLLKIISQGQKAIKSEGGIINFLQKKNVSNVKVDEIFFKKVTKKEEEAQKTEKQLENVLIVNYLLGKTSISKNDIKSLAGEITINPKRMGKIISDAAVSGTGETKNGIEFARSSIEKLAVHIKGVPGKSDDDVKSNIGNLILAFEPSLRSRVLQTEIKISEKGNDFTKEVITAFSDEILVDLIVSDFVDKKTSIVEIKKFIQKLLPDIAKRKKIFPVLEKRLLQRGVSQKTCSKILEEEFWSDMTNEGKVKKIQKEEPLYCAEIGIADEILSLIQNLLSERNFNPIGGITDKILDNLRSKDSDFKIRVIRDFQKIFNLLFQSEDYPYKEDLINKMTAEFKKITEENVRQRFAEILAFSVKTCIKNKWYAYIPSLVNDIGHKKLKGGAIASLTDILLSISSDDFDSYKKRHNIAGILKEMGKDAEGFLIDKLSSKNIDVLKNSLEALSEIGQDKSIQPVEKFLDHKNTKIRDHAKFALKNIKKRLG